MLRLTRSAISSRRRWTAGVLPLPKYTADHRSLGFGSYKKLVWHHLSFSGAVPQHRRHLVDAAGCIDDRAASFAIHLNMVTGVQHCFDVYWIFSKDRCNSSFIEVLENLLVLLIPKIKFMLCFPTRTLKKILTSQAILEPQYNDSMGKLCN